MVAHETALKTRKISFYHKQAEDALDMLKDVSSITKVSLQNSKQIAVTYDIRKLSLQIIESALKEVGFVLNNGLLQRIKRAICAYCEDAERERLGINFEDEIHKDTLQLNKRTALDPRPNDWRNYT